MNSTEPAASSRRLDVAGGRIGEEGREDRQRLLLPALEPPAQPRDLPRVVEVAPLERRQQAPQPLLVLAEPGDLQPRLGVRGPDQRPRGEQQVDSLGDDQLADEDDQRR